MIQIRIKIHYSVSNLELLNRKLCNITITNTDIDKELLL